GPLLSPGAQLGAAVAGAGPDELDPADLADHVPALARTGEELPVPEDARHAGALEDLLAHDLEPQLVDLVDLGEEAVAAEVEPVAVADLGLGDAADLPLGFDDHDREPLFGQEVAGREAGGTGAEHKNRALASSVGGGNGGHTG